MEFNAQDLMNQNNNRSDAVARLQALCHELGLDYTFGSKEFTVKLPEQEPIPIANYPGTHVHTPKRKKFDISKWGDKSIDESDILPDELPPADKPLEEGETPKGDDEV